MPSIDLNQPLDLDDFDSNPRQYIVSMIGREEYILPIDFVVDMIGLLSEDQLRVMLTRLGHTPKSFE